MKYYSTRTDPDAPGEGRSAAEVIVSGIADDGGLYMPDSIPRVGPDFISSLLPLDYCGRSDKILSLYLDGFEPDEIRKCGTDAYSAPAFPADPAPTVKLKDGLHVLELWHGPTCAFKDMALQIMPKLLSLSIPKSGEKRDALILVATSGDTGKAALEGFRDVPGVRISVFYPADGVSRVQKAQMITQKGENVSVCGIRGNFDDAQSGVKRIFGDAQTVRRIARRGYFLSSANSINWGRLLPQITYYFSSYCDLVNSGEITAGDMINFCVPTGNFGDIFAGYMATLMGLPVRRLVCASNSNNVLTDFFATGVYDRNRRFYTTASPSMDILISSNLERLLSVTAGYAKTAGYMESLKETGRYSVDEEVMNEIRDVFDAGYATDEESFGTIRRCFSDYSYLIDTHTSVALSCIEKYREKTGDMTPAVVLSTASPFKFAGSVYTSVTGKEAPSGYAALEALEESASVPIPEPLRDIDKREIRFPDEIDPADMADHILREI